MARGDAKVLLGHPTEAFRTNHSYCQLSETHQEYPRLFIWLIQVRERQEEVANAALASYLDQRPEVPSRAWASEVGKFLLGRQTEAELFAEGATAGQRCEAWYYSGMKRLLTRDKAGAADHFRQCMATGQTAFTEYEFAVVELKALAP